MIANVIPCEKKRYIDKTIAYTDYSLADSKYSCTALFDAADVPVIMSAKRVTGLFYFVFNGGSNADLYFNLTSPMELDTNSIKPELHANSYGNQGGLEEAYIGYRKTTNVVWGYSVFTEERLNTLKQAAPSGYIVLRLLLEQ